MTEFSKEKITGLAGLLSPFLIFVFTISSIMLHPWFNFSDYAFSHLGKIGISLNFVFNIGLILGGVSGLIFSLGLFYVSNNKISRIGSVLFGLGMLFFILLGLFPMGMILHYLAAAAFYLLSISGILAKTIGDFKIEKVLSSFLFLTVIVCISLLGYLNIAKYDLGLAITETIAFIPILEFKIAYGTKLIFN